MTICTDYSTAAEIITTDETRDDGVTMHTLNIGGNSYDPGLSPETMAKIAPEFAYTPIYGMLDEPTIWVFSMSNNILIELLDYAGNEGMVVIEDGSMGFDIIVNPDFEDADLLLLEFITRKIDELCNS